MLLAGSADTLYRHFLTKQLRATEAFTDAEDWPAGGSECCHSGLSGWGRTGRPRGEERQN
jgi:hypothetical protein